ncbi:NAD-dependent epimerase/dehydratase family protein [Candidatus Saccharibacteria bacterium]|nr:NAD-dependent epimerase/dehydratase family protein [Candidatus Saccharibacteria bacterium]
MFKRVLVVGGAGYVGSAITKIHLEIGCKVMVFDNLSSGNRERLPLQNENLIFYEGSIADIESISSAVEQFRPEVVFHMAALHYIPHCINDPELVIETNITGTLNVIAAIDKLPLKPKLIFTSSAAVYGAVTAAPQSITAISQPCDIYGYSKMIGEHLVSTRYEDYVIARLFNVFGDKDPIPHLIPSIVRQLGKEVIELGNPDSERDFIYVKDAARAFAALAKQGKCQNVYNIGSGVCFSVKQATDIIKEMSGSSAEFVFQATERRKVDPKILCADITDIMSDTDWRPTITFEQGLRTVLDNSDDSSIREVSSISSQTYRKPLCLQDYIAVVSDFDDTIVDNRNTIAGGLHEISRMRALREVEKANGINLLSHITPAMSVAAIVNAPVHVSEGAFWWLLSEVGVIEKNKPFNPEHPLIQQLTKAKSRHYKKLLTTQAREVPGAQSFFHFLYNNGYAGKLAIASSGRREDITAFLSGHGFKDLFHDLNIVSREDVNKLKPHPESYLKAVKLMGIVESDMHKVIAFEDDPIGIMAAKKAGLTVCAVTTRFTREQFLSQPVSPDFIASDFTQYARLFGLRIAEPIQPSVINSRQESKMVVR